MSLSLTSILQELQTKTSFQRRLLLGHYLRKLQVPFQEQEFSLDHHANIQVDIPEDHSVPLRQHLSCYYDRDGDDGSDPNDGATPTTVLQGLVERKPGVQKYIQYANHYAQGHKRYLVRGKVEITGKNINPL